RFDFVGDHRDALLVEPLAHLNELLYLAGNAGTVELSNARRPEGCQPCLRVARHVRAEPRRFELELPRGAGHIRQLPADGRPEVEHEAGRMSNDRYSL